MRAASRFQRLVFLCIFVASLVPASAAYGAAQGEDCPEGLVYLEDEDLCVLPEDVPEEDPGEQIDGTGDEDTADQEDADDLDQTDDAGEAVDEGDFEEEPGYINEIYLQHF